MICYSIYFIKRRDSGASEAQNAKHRQIKSAPNWMFFLLCQILNSRKMNFIITRKN